MSIKVTDLILIAILLVICLAWRHYITLGNTGLPF